mmetsp:Transcript_36640/g.44801  ORF Transcript_36640/g.44801 Transcript_36640/m.44801 type:complete len:247 (-) Transcript_36640:178-918(-)
MKLMPGSAPGRHYAREMYSSSAVIAEPGISCGSALGELYSWKVASTHAPTLEHRHDAACVAASISARIGEPLVVLGKEHGRLHIPVPQIHHILTHRMVVLHIESGSVGIIIRQSGLLLLHTAVLLHRLDDGLLFRLAVLRLLRGLGRRALIFVVRRVIVHFLQASGARPVVVRRRSDHCGERLAHLLELSSDVLLDVNTEVIAVRDSGRLEHQPELCLLEVVDCERGLLSHEPSELREGSVGCKPL